MKMFDLGRVAVGTFFLAAAAAAEDVFAKQDKKRAVEIKRTDLPRIKQKWSIPWGTGSLD